MHAWEAICQEEQSGEEGSMDANLNISSAIALNPKARGRRGGQAWPWFLLKQGHIRQPSCLRGYQTTPGTAPKQEVSAAVEKFSAIYS